MKPNYKPCACPYCGSKHPTKGSATNCWLRWQDKAIRWLIATMQKHHPERVVAK